MNFKNKFSIIIPTRERGEYLFHTIRTCLNQTYENFEIIISDNYSQDNTKLIIDSFNDSRIKYFNTGKRLSMSENFDFALSHVSDGYIMFIGDDDAILPNSLDYVNNIINSTNCEAVVSYNSFYTWPGTSQPNKLSWSSKTNFEVRNSKKWIDNYMKFKMEYTFDLPSIYCGFVKRSVLDNLITNNTFFKSSTPDAYSAIAVAFNIDFYVYSFKPFVIHGSSPRSNGGSYLGKSKGDEGDELKLFFKENIIPFHKEIVMTKSFRVCSVEAFLQFSDSFPDYTKGYKINWEKLLKYVLTERKDNTEEEILDAVKKMCLIHGVDYNYILNNPPNKFSDTPIIEMISRLLIKIKNLVLNRKATISISDVGEYGVNNVYDASLFLNFFKI